MSEKSNNKMKIWVYAVILFTSAFIVLLFTAYSQIKVNRSISDYKNQIYTKENEKNKFRLNFESASQENVRLKEEKEVLNGDLVKANEALKQQKEEAEKVQKEGMDRVNAYEILLQAQKEYDAGNIVSCAETLQQFVNTSHLSKNGLDTYNDLVEKAYKEAAHIVYKEAYNQYKKKQYDSAARQFQKSLSFSDREYFSDDCYYFLALIEYRTYKNDHSQNAASSTRQYIGTLLQKYPDSSYTKDVEQLLKLLNE